MKEWIHQNKSSLVKLSILFLMMLGLCILLYQPFMDIIANKEAFKTKMDSYGMWAYVIYICINMLQVFLAFIPGEVVEVLAGFCFGSINGAIACMVASFLASSLVFCLVRLFGKKILHAFVKQDDLENVAFIHKEEKLTLIAFIIFLIPGTPKDLFTYVLPLTQIKYITFAWITTLARFPSIITSTIAGEAIINANITMVIIVYILTAIIGIIGIVWYQNFKLKKQKVS